MSFVEVLFFIPAVFCCVALSDLYAQQGKIITEIQNLFEQQGKIITEIKNLMNNFDIIMMRKSLAEIASELRTKDK